ncbi:MAG: MBL fold metallo-hydrolase [Rhodanobacteraceae bacterium]|nr:MAG: MBL fold metallo-hydrolase [Rhodanobacteraceae bacterium]
MGVPALVAMLRAFAILAFALAVGVPGADAAQNAPVPGSNRDTQIVFLGTAGGPPLRLDRSEPSTLLIVDGREYLVDCGIGTMRRMIEAGTKSEQVKTIFLTHLHADHDLGLAEVMANDFFRAGPTEVAGSFNIYGPPQTGELVDAAFRFITVGFRPFAAENPAGFRIVDGHFASPFVTHEFNRDGLVFRDDKISVTAVENSHYALMPVERRVALKSYSYRIETPHGVIVFTGDTGPSDAVARLAKGADVLVAEASSRDSADIDRLVNSMAAQNHWSPERANRFRDHFRLEHLDTGSIGKLAAKAGVKAVLLYHYDPEDETDQAAYARGVKRQFSGPVFAPDDLDRYCMVTGIVGSCEHKAHQFSH